MGKRHELTKLNDYSFNFEKALVGTRLIGTYHTIIKIPDYYNKLLDDPHWHKLSFAIFVIKGSLSVAKGDQTIKVEENHIIFGETGNDVALLDDGNEAEFACFYFQIFNHVLPLFTSYRVSHDAFLDTLSDILTNLKHQDTLSYGYANAKFETMLFEWLKEIHTKTTTNNPQAQMIYRVEVYINEHVEEKLLVADLAKECHYSEKHFRNLFTKIIGVPPKKYIENVKLEVAYNLLTNTDKTIDEIANKLSFSSSHHLTNAFKSLYGVPPSAYRQNEIDEK